MNHWWIPVADLFASRRKFHAMQHRGDRRPELSCQALEDRVTPSHGAGHHLAAALNFHHEVAHHSSGTTTTSPITPSSGRSPCPFACRPVFPGNTTAAGHLAGDGTGAAVANPRIPRCKRHSRT